MKNASKAVHRLTPILFAALVLVALPEPARGATPLARGAGYDSPHGAHQVALLQQRLWLVGIAAGPVDGRFGPVTEAAVRRYQHRDGLPVDGVAGPHTQAALRAAIRLVGRGAGYGQPNGSGRVRRLQRALRAAGDSPGPLDGRFGPATQAAIKRFQREHGLPADGVAGDRTTRELERVLRRSSAEAQGEAGEQAPAQPGPHAQAHGQTQPDAEQANGRAKPDAQGQPQGAARPTPTRSQDGGNGAALKSRTQARPQGQAKPAPSRSLNRPAPASRGQEPQRQANPAPSRSLNGPAPGSRGQEPQGQAEPVPSRSLSSPAPAPRGQEQARPQGHATPAAPPTDAAGGTAPRAQAPATRGAEAGARAGGRRGGAGGSASTAVVLLLLGVIVLAGAGVLGVPEKLVARQARRRARAAAPYELTDAALAGRDELPVVDASRRPRRPKPPAQLPPAERGPGARRPAPERGGSRM